MPGDMHEFSIIAGGPSARNIDLAALPGLIICVNDAAMHAPKCDIIVSMDRNWLENRWDALEFLEIPTYARLSALRNKLDSLCRPWLRPFECRHELATFGDYACTLNGPHSGHCALNLAFVYRPQRINLVGFDMARGPNGETHWWPAYSWAKPVAPTPNRPHDHWRGALQEGIRQCEAVGIEVVRYS